MFCGVYGLANGVLEVWLKAYGTWAGCVTYLVKVIPFEPYVASDSLHELLEDSGGQHLHNNIQCTAPWDA